MSAGCKKDIYSPPHRSLNLQIKMPKRKSRFEMGLLNNTLQLYSHTMSGFKRAVRIVFLVWTVSLESNSIDYGNFLKQFWGHFWDIYFRNVFANFWAIFEVYWITTQCAAAPYFLFTRINYIDRPLKSGHFLEDSAFCALLSDNIYPKVQLLQGDHAGLTKSFVDFYLVCNSVYPIVLRQVIIGQEWHNKWVNWQNSWIEANKV